MRKEVAAYALLIDYAWAVIKANASYMTDDAYGGLVPIIPLSDQPEFDEYSTKPIIIYGYSLLATGNPPARRYGAMSFSVQHEDFQKVTELTNILVEAFGRSDESARDVNIFTSRLPHYVGLSFGTIEVSFAEGGQPEELEGGDLVGTVNISFEYYVNYDITTRV